MQIDNGGGGGEGGRNRSDEQLRLSRDLKLVGERLIEAAQFDDSSDSKRDDGGDNTHNSEPNRGEMEHQRRLCEDFREALNSAHVTFERWQEGNRKEVERLRRESPFLLGQPGATIVHRMVDFSFRVLNIEVSCRKRAFFK
jgi:hypothetical protein